MTIHIWENLFIREVEKADATETYKLIDNNREYLKKWCPWVDYKLCLHDQLKYIESVIENEKDNDFVIVYNGDIIGVIGYSMITEYTAYIGYWIDEKLQGRGIVSKSCEELIRYLINKKNAHRIEIRVDEQNSRSRKIPEGLGFKLEGILRDVEYKDGKFESEAVYSLLKTEI